MIRHDTDYALRMLVRLAEMSPQGIPASKLSSQLDVPHGFAQKILRKLASAGILEVKPGRSGGFQLARQPAEVSLMDVVATIQGPPLLNRCMASPEVCAMQPSCNISASLRVFQDKFNAFLCSTNLLKIAGGRRGAAHRRLGKDKSVSRSRRHQQRRIK